MPLSEGRAVVRATLKWGRGEKHANRDGRQLKNSAPHNSSKAKSSTHANHNSTGACTYVRNACSTAVAFKTVSMPVCSEYVYQQLNSHVQATVVVAYGAGKRHT